MWATNGAVAKEVRVSCLASCVLTNVAERGAWQNSIVFHRNELGDARDTQEISGTSGSGHFFRAHVDVWANAFIEKAPTRTKNVLPMSFERPVMNTRHLELWSRVDGCCLPAQLRVDEHRRWRVTSSLSFYLKLLSTHSRHHLERSNIVLSRNSDHVASATTSPRAKRQPSCIGPERPPPGEYFRRYLVFVRVFGGCSLVCVLFCRVFASFVLRFWFVCARASVFIFQCFFVRAPLRLYVCILFFVRARLYVYFCVSWVQFSVGSTRLVNSGDATPLRLFSPDLHANVTSKPRLTTEG